MPRYSDLNLNNGQYVEQYAPLPLDQIQRSADTLATRHYQNLASLTQLQLLREQYKSKMLPGASSYIDEHFGDIDLALQDIAKNGGENATARVGAITNRFLGDQGVLKGLQQADSVAKEIETENNLIAQGRMPIRKAGAREALMQAPILDPETGKLNSLYQQPYKHTVAPYEDPTPHMKRIWDEVNPDSIESILHAADKTTLKDLLGESMASGMPDVPLFFESLTKAGIGKDKIDKMLNSAWSSYQQTPAYKQAVDYSENSSKEEKRQKDQFYKHGLLNVYNNISRQYMNNPIADDLLRKGKDKGTGQITQAPGQTVSAMFKYNQDGYPSDFSSKAVEFGGGEVLGTGGNKVVEKPKEYDPQYVKDYKAMLEISGRDTNVEPGSPEAKKAALNYKGLVQNRVENPYVKLYGADDLTDENKKIQQEWRLYEYMNTSTGEIFHPLDNNGKPTDEFMKMTGGDPTKFKAEAIYDAKNHYSTLAGGDNSKWASPRSFTAQTEDGPVSFLAAKPGQSSLKEINTNVVYNKVNMRPGQEAEIHPRIKATSLAGEQLTPALQNKIREAIASGQVNPEDVTLPIKATVDGETLLFLSPEDLADYAMKRGITLTNQ